MPRHIVRPARIAATGDPPKQIEESIGRVNSAEYIAVSLPAFSPDLVNRI